MINLKTVKRVPSALMIAHGLDGKGKGSLRTGWHWCLAIDWHEPWVGVSWDRGALPATLSGGRRGTIAFMEVWLGFLPMLSLHVSRIEFIEGPPPDPSGWCPGMGPKSHGPPCCERAGEYNGYGSDGPLAFHCPKNCGCHD